MEFFLFNEKGSRKFYRNKVPTLHAHSKGLLPPKEHFPPLYITSHLTNWKHFSGSVPIIWQRMQGLLSFQSLSDDMAKELPSGLYYFVNVPITLLCWIGTRSYILFEYQCTYQNRHYIHHNFKSVCMGS